MTTDTSCDVSLPLGIAPIDAKCGPRRRGELVIVTGRMSVGKSFFILQAARQQAQQGHKVAFVSFEMSAKEVTERAIPGMTGISSRRLRQGVFTADETARIRDAADEVEGLPLHIWDPPTATVRQLQAFARCHQAERGLDILHVDYLKRVRPSGREKDRREAVDAMAQGLKTIAREIGILLVASCQLSRAGEGDPTLSHLRESGAIEQEADGVILLSRDDEDVTADVAKNRHGPCGEIRLRFNKRTLTFEGEAAERCRNYEPAFN